MPRHILVVGRLGVGSSPVVAPNFVPRYTKCTPKSTPYEYQVLGDWGNATLLLREQG